MIPLRSAPSACSDYGLSSVWMRHACQRSDGVSRVSQPALPGGPELQLRFIAQLPRLPMQPDKNHVAVHEPRFERAAPGRDSRPRALGAIAARAAALGR